MKKTDQTELAIYETICRSGGIKAREIAKMINADRHTVNHYLYGSPFMKELCYKDQDDRWHGMIRQCRPHKGIGNFSGYYDSVKAFREAEEEDWFAAMKTGCANIGRNLNDTRGLFHSFLDTRKVMLSLFDDLEKMSEIDLDTWEIVFELRIKRSRMIRIYADVLVITEDKVFALEFKMKDMIEAKEVSQASKYVRYLEILFGSDYDVIPCLVLTRAQDLYTYTVLPGSTAEIPVCAGDMLFNLFDEYLGILD